MNVPEIDVERIMQRIREEVARRRAQMASIPEYPEQEAKRASGDVGSAGTTLPPAAAVAGPEPIRLTLPQTDDSSGPGPFRPSQEGFCKLEDLLPLDDVEFVKASYRAILGREVDENGKKCYVTMLRDGASKVEILGRLLASPEGRARHARVSGLSLPLTFDSVSRWPILGRLLGIVVGIWNLPANARKYRRLSNALAYRFAQLEQNSARNREIVYEALRTLERSQNYFNTLTGSLADRASLDAIREELKRTTKSLDTLHRTSVEKVDRQQFDGRLGELWAQIEAKANHNTVAAVNRQIQSISENKASRADLENIAARINAALTVLDEGKASSLDLMETCAFIEDHAKAIATIQASKASVSEMETIHKTIQRAIDAKPERQELTTLTNHFQSISESKASRADLENIAARINAALTALDESKASSLDLMETCAVIEDHAKAIATIQASKASVSEMETIHKTIQRAIDAKPERQELTTLTNHFVEILQHRATKDDLAAVVLLMEKANDAIANIRQHKADLGDLAELSKDIEKRSRVALDGVNWTIQALSKEKADRLMVEALRGEVNDAVKEVSLTAGEELRGSLAGVRSALEALQRSKADESTVHQLQAESAGFNEEMRKTVQALAKEKVDQSVVEAFRADFNNAINEVSQTAGETLRGSIAELRSALDSLHRSKADESTVQALRADSLGIAEEMRKAWNERFDRLIAQKADLAAVEAVNANLNTAIANSQRIFAGKWEEFAAVKANQVVVDGLKAQITTSLEEIRKHLSERLEGLAANKANVDAIEAWKSDASSALENVRSRVNAKLEEISANKVDRSTIEALRAEAVGTIEENRKAVLKELSAALAVANSRTQDLRRNVLDQERRIGLLLEEARKRFPEPISTEQLGAMLAEEDHRLDSMYASFEDQFRGTREEIRERQAIYLPYVRDAKAGTEGSPTIDVGCGRGEWLELLRDNGLVARGVDHNRVTLSVCRERNLDVTENDGLQFLRQLKSGSVGAVTSFHLIEHLSHKDFVALVDEAFRVLRPGGIVIFETPNPKNLMVASCNFYLDPTHRNPLPGELSRYVLEARGFVGVEIKELHPMPVDRFITGGHPMVNDVLNQMLNSAQDYAVIGRRA